LAKAAPISAHWSASLPDTLNLAPFYSIWLPATRFGLTSDKRQTTIHSRHTRKPVLWRGTVSLSLASRHKGGHTQAAHKPQGGHNGAQRRGGPKGKGARVSLQFGISNLAGPLQTVCGAALAFALALAWACLLACRLACWAPKWAQLRAGCWKSSWRRTETKLRVQVGRSEGEMAEAKWEMGILCRLFDVRRSMFDVPCSMLDVRWAFCSSRLPVGRAFCLPARAGLWQWRHFAYRQPRTHTALLWGAKKGNKFDERRHLTGDKERHATAAGP